MVAVRQRLQLSFGDGMIATSIRTAVTFTAIENGDNSSIDRQTSREIMEKKEEGSHTPGTPAGKRPREFEAELSFWRLVKEEWT